MYKSQPVAGAKSYNWEQNGLDFMNSDIIFTEDNFCREQETAFLYVECSNKACDKLMYINIYIMYMYMFNVQKYRTFAVYKELYLFV